MGLDNSADIILQEDSILTVFLCLIPDFFSNLILELSEIGIFATNLIQFVFGFSLSQTSVFVQAYFSELLQDFIIVRHPYL